MVLHLTHQVFESSQRFSEMHKVAMKNSCLSQGKNTLQQTGAKDREEAQGGDDAGGRREAAR